MKPISRIAIIVALLATSCSTPAPTKPSEEENSIFNKKIRCSELRDAIINRNIGDKIGLVFYSPKLNTCVFGVARIANNTGPLVEVEDALTGERLWPPKDVATPGPLGEFLDDLRSEPTK